MDVRSKSPSSGILKNSSSAGSLSSVVAYPLRPIFHANYTTGGVDALISSGSGTATLSASRGSSNPATYIDSNGVMQKTETSDVPRFQSGYYNDTGFYLYGQSGLMIEGASTNYLPHTIFDTDSDLDGIADNWVPAGTLNGSPTVSLVDVSSTFNVGDTVNSQRMQYTGVSGDSGEEYQIGTVLSAIGSFSQNDYITASFYIKGSVSGCDVLISILTGDAGASTLEQVNKVITSSLDADNFTFVSVFLQPTNVNTSRARMRVRFSGVDDGDTFDIQIACAQLEKKEYPTSFIPTTTTSLTRNREQLTYTSSSNINASVGSIIVKHAPFVPSPLLSTHVLFSTDPDVIIMRYDTGGNDKSVHFYPNETDSLTEVTDIIDADWSANDIITVGVNYQHSSPYVAGFYNGVADGTNDTSTDFVTADVGTNLYVGTQDSSGNNTFYGVIFQVLIFDQVLSETQQSQAHNFQDSVVRV